MMQDFVMVQDFITDPCTAILADAAFRNAADSVHHNRRGLARRYLAAARDHRWSIHRAS